MSIQNSKKPEIHVGVDRAVGDDYASVVVFEKDGNYVTVLREFDSPNKFIRWIFKDRCIICNQQADVIHEIIPRSSGEGSMDWHNRVTLCNGHHREIHDEGVNDKQISGLQELRSEFLEMIGREEYI